MEFVGNEGEVEQLRFKTVILRLYADNQSLEGKAVPHVVETKPDYGGAYIPITKAKASA